MIETKNAAGATSPTASQELLNSKAIVPPEATVDDVDSDGIAPDDYIEPHQFYRSPVAHKRTFIFEGGKHDLDAFIRARRPGVVLPHWEQDAAAVAGEVQGKAVHILARPSRLPAANRYAAALRSNTRKPEYVQVITIAENTDLAGELDAGRGLKDVTGRPIIRGTERDTDTGKSAVMLEADKLDEATLDRDALEEVADPTPILDDFLYFDSLARVIGPPGSFKTYVLLDMALCISTGKPWHGRATVPGGAPVLILVGEGLSGIKARIRAWEAEFNDGAKVGYDEDGDQTLHILPAPMNLASDDPKVLGLIEKARRWQYKFIVVDTQARFTVGAEENSATDMGVLVDTLDALREASGGACVVSAHHTTRGAEHGRGSTAVFGALESELVLLRGDDNAVILRTGKQKNVEEAEDVHLRLCPVADNLVVRTLDEVGGGVGMDLMGHLQAPLPPRGRRDKSPNYEKLARFVWETYQGGSGATKGEVKAALKAATWGTEPDTEIRLSGRESSYRQRFDESWTALEKRKWIAKVGGRERFLLSAAAVEELGYSDQDDTAGEVAAND